MLNKMLKNIKELLSLARFLCSFILQNQLHLFLILLQSSASCLLVEVSVFKHALNKLFDWLTVIT